MSEPAQKCENFAIFKQNYTLELFIAFKMAYSCCFSLGGNLDFIYFLFYNINSRYCFRYYLHITLTVIIHSGTLLKTSLILILNIRLVILFLQARSIHWG